MIIDWSVSPIAFTLAGFDVRWYGVIHASCFLLAYCWFVGTVKQEEISQCDKRSILLLMLFATVVGGRVGHCLFYHAESTWDSPASVLDFRQGGNSSHGAVVASVVFMAIYARSKRWSIRWLFDRLCVPIPFAAAGIRVGNFMNSEILGTPTHSNWGIVFARVDMIPRHPVVLYESIANLAVFAILVCLYQREGSARRGLLFGVFLFTLFGARFLLEWLKDSPHVSSSLPMTVGQLLSVPCILLGVYCMAASRIPKALGAVGA